MQQKKAGCPGGQAMWNFSGVAHFYSGFSWDLSLRFVGLRMEV